MTFLLAALLAFQEGDALWRDLRQADAGLAYERIWKGGDAKTCADLRSRLIPRVDKSHVKVLISRLASDVAETRERAVAGIVDMGLDVEDVLKSELESASDKSVKASLESVLKAIHRPDLDSPILVQRVRAIRFLKRAGADADLLLVAAGARTAFERAWAESLRSDALTPETNSEEGLRAFDELALHYEGAVAVPAYDQAVDLLPSEAGRRAGRYLAALLRQLLADEKNGRAEWRQNPYWGKPADNTARELRASVAGAFGERAEGADALVAARWLLTEEEIAANGAEGMKAIARITTPAANELIRTVLESLHPNERILQEAIGLAADRGLKEAYPAILNLCVHYRKAIREKARETAAVLGLKPIPDFAPEKSLTAALESRLAEIASMVRAEIPREAPWREFHVKLPSDGWNSAIDERIPGWLVSETGEELRVVTWFGVGQRWPRNAVTVSERRLDKEPERFASARSVKDGADELSPMGGLTRQFEPAWFSLPEVLVAAWALQREDRATAAAVLLPRIDATEDDRWISWASRDFLGRAIHQEMLDAFSHRDYALAIAAGRHLSRARFDGYRYQERAKELVRQLESRSEDFKSFRLPERGEWAALQAKLTRAEQVRFLASRLCLLNCFQRGQPMDVDFDDPQTKKPGRSPQNRDDGLINPFSELRNLKLTPEDLETLAEFAGDTRFILAYEYWRDFAPGRTLFRVGHLVGRLVNEAAHREIVNVSELMDAPARDFATQKARILEWATPRRGKSSADLALEAIAVGREWWDVRIAVVDCIQMGEARVFRAMKARLKDFPKQQFEAAALAFYMKTPEAASQARLWLEDDDPYVRYWASRILLRHGRKGEREGYAELKSALQEKGMIEYFARALDDVLAVGSEEALQFACTILKREGFEHRESRGPVLHRLLLAGRLEAVEYFEANIDNPKVLYIIGTDDSDSPDKKVTYGDVLAALLSGWTLPPREFDQYASAAKRLAWRKELKPWIQRQKKLIKDGKKPEVGGEPHPLPRWGDFKE